MSHNSAHIYRIAQKELSLFFSSPIAYLFLACFSVVTLFIFFWGEAFFARNIADVRPLFEWMPLLLIFLASTLTMRLWSEEKRTGTLEYVLTQPVPLWQFTLGKFIACLVLLTIALVITLPLPITVSLFSDLDWGPVIAGYIATFLLGAAYLSIGLFVSAKSDNQIVSLITSVAIAGAFYLIGSHTITSLFGNHVAALLESLGSGSRFSSITRGIIDFRDLYYYLSIIVLFLTLNTYVLEKARWSDTGRKTKHLLWRQASVLFIVNVILVNVWLSQFSSLRIDMTQGKQYTLSQVSKNYLHQLQEPLLIRAYFSRKTHPLLAPLVPQLTDLLKEYQIAGNGKIKLEVIDPANHPELEQEANQKYGIKPVPFQVADRYQSSIVSSYFNVLISYGNEYQVLSFSDLIEVKEQPNQQKIDVQLRNPEHDITSAIKKVLEKYQTSGNLFDTIHQPVTFTAYLSADEHLPKALRTYKQTVLDIAHGYEQQAKGQFTMHVIDPEQNGGQLAKKLLTDYGFQPMATSLLSSEHFYFYLTLTSGKQMVQIPFHDLNKASLQRNFKSALQRFAKGFSKHVALVAPKSNPQLARFGMAGAQYNQLQRLLGKDLDIEKEDLSDGHVSGNADVLLLLAPKELDQKQLFAVDQFLMQGGTVVVASSPFSASFANQRLSVVPHTSGLEAWLAHNGLSMDNKLVMDSQNSALPIPITRNVNGFQVREMKMIDYPYFVDVRGKGLNAHNMITEQLPQVTMAWSSPIIVDKAKQNGRKITELLRSSAHSWLSNSTDVMPKIDAQGNSLFVPQGEQKSRLLGVISQGSFSSFFANKPSPLAAIPAKPAMKDNATPSAKPNAKPTPEPISLARVIKRSPESARIILMSSNDFLRDQVEQMSGVANGTKNDDNNQLMANTLAWATDDQGLTSISSRGHFNRTLPPMHHQQQLFWEYLNYALALLLLIVVALIQRHRKRKQQQFYQTMLASTVNKVGGQ